MDELDESVTDDTLVYADETTLADTDRIPVITDTMIAAAVKDERRKLIAAQMQAMAALSHEEYVDVLNQRARQRAANAAYLSAQGQPPTDPYCALCGAPAHSGACRA